MITSNSTIETKETIQVNKHTPCNNLTSRTIIASAEVHCHQSICKQLPTLCSPHHELRNEKGRQFSSQGTTTEYESRKFVLNTYNPLHEERSGKKGQQQTLYFSYTKTLLSKHRNTSSDRETLIPLSSRESEQNANPRRWKEGVINGREISDPKLAWGKGKGREARRGKLGSGEIKAKEMSSNMDTESEYLETLSLGIGKELVNPKTRMTCISRYLRHSDTLAHDPEGIGCYSPGIGQYLNTSSHSNPITHLVNQLHFWDIFWSIG